MSLTASARSSAVGRERAPGRERDRVAHGGLERARRRARPPQEHVGGLVEVRVRAARRRRGRSRRARRRGATLAEHRRGALVIGVELVEGSREPLPRVADRAPRVEIGQRVGARSSGVEHAVEQVGLGREVAVERAALDARPLGDRAQRRARRPDGAVQLDRRLGDPQVRLGHVRGALLQLVLALG